MKYKIDDIAEYIVWLISDFANKYSLNNVQAYDYLSKYKAIPFIEDYYDVLHTFSLENAVEDVAKFCRRKGGTL